MHSYTMKAMSIFDRFNVEGGRKSVKKYTDELLWTLSWHAFSVENSTEVMTFEGTLNE